MLRMWMPTSSVPCGLQYLVAMYFVKDNVWVSWEQAAQMGALEKEAQQLRAEVRAQQLALGAIAAERDAARSAAADSSERLKVRHARFSLE